MVRTRNGGTSRQIENYSVGTRIELFAKKSETGNEVPSVDLNKSSVFASDEVLYKAESGEKTLAQNVTNVDRALPWNDKCGFEDRSDRREH